MLQHFSLLVILYYRFESLVSSVLILDYGTGMQDARSIVFTPSVGQ